MQFLKIAILLSKIAVLFSLEFRFLPTKPLLRSQCFKATQNIQRVESVPNGALHCCTEITSFSIARVA